MLAWWNGIHITLKMLRPQGHLGSTPRVSTIMSKIIEPGTEVKYKDSVYVVYASTPSYVLLESERGNIIQVKVNEIK